MADVQALSGRTIAVLTYPRYQELEFWYPVLRSREEGATVNVVAPSTAECESFLGYPVVGDVAAADVDVATLAAVVVPGSVDGEPEASAEQLQLIGAAIANGTPVYTIGNGSGVVRRASDVDDVPPQRHAADADSLPQLFRSLTGELADQTAGRGSH